ncbi:MAG: hypothetical protein ACI9C1_002501 [Candidatus Aldehydirespiratoraceae bacterium]|jgi:hypothetical protein
MSIRLASRVVVRPATTPRNAPHKRANGEVITVRKASVRTGPTGNKSQALTCARPQAIATSASPVSTGIATQADIASHSREPSSTRNALAESNNSIDERCRCPLRNQGANRLATETNATATGAHPEIARPRIPAT